MSSHIDGTMTIGNAVGVVADGFLTYASFAGDSARRQKAGWRVGQRQGVPAEEAEALIATAPTHLASEAPVPRYVGEKERAELIHRGVWTLAPWDSSVNVFVHSTPAGNDASGRPANVFTTMYVFEASNRLAVHPALLLGSEDILVPFNAEVNKEEVTGPRIAVNPELTPRAACDHLMRRTRRGFHAIRDIVSTILDCLATMTPVVIADDTRNAAYWLTLTTLALVPDAARKVSFSTYERASALIQAGRPEYRISVVPAVDVEMLRSSDFGGAVIDVSSGVTRGQWEGDPTRYGCSGEDQVDVSALSALYEHLVSSPATADRLLDSSIQTGKLAEKLALIALENPDSALADVGGPLQHVAAAADRGSRLEQVYCEAAGEDAAARREEEPAAQAVPPEPSTSISDENPFADPTPTVRVEPMPADEPRQENLVQVSVRFVAGERQQKLLESLTPVGPGVRKDLDVCWSDMSEFLLAEIPAGTREEKMQVEMFSVAAARRLASSSSTTAMIPPLPYWRILTPGHQPLFEDVLRRTAELIEEVSGNSSQVRDRLYDQAGRLSSGWRDPQSPNPAFAKFLESLVNYVNTAPDAPPHHRADRTATWHR